MAWYGGNHTSSAAGTLITILDEYLPENPFWSIFDASAGTNCKVYKCEDANVNCLFYVKVNDNFSGYALIELWEDWDDTGHAGVGRSRTLFSSTYTFVINRYTTIGSNGWFLSVQDHHFKYISCYTYWTGTYIGRPRLFDESKNVVIFCGQAYGGSNNYNPLAYFANNADGGLAFLFDASYGGTSLGGMTAGASSSITRYAWTPHGDAFGEEVMIRNTTSNDFVCAGCLEGVINAGAYIIGSGRIYDIEGTKWIGVVGNSGYGCLVRMA